MKLNFKLIIKTIVLTCLSLFFLFLILRTFIIYEGREGMTTDVSGIAVDIMDASGVTANSTDVSGTVIKPLDVSGTVIKSLDISGVVAIVPSPIVDNVSPSASSPIN